MKKASLVLSVVLLLATLVGCSQVALPKLGVEVPPKSPQEEDERGNIDQNEAVAVIEPLAVVESAPKVEHWDWLVPKDYKTLEEAIQVAEDGDVIRIMGTINEMIRISNKVLTIVGDGKDISVLNGGLILDGSQISFKYLTVQNIEIRGSGTVFNGSDIDLGLLTAGRSNVINIVDSQIRSINTGGAVVTIEGSIIGEKRKASVISGYIVGNEIIGMVEIGGQVKNNIFTEQAIVVVGGSGSVFEYNKFLRAEAVSDNGDNNLWRMNYWKGWDYNKPMPIKGEAGSVDSTPISEEEALGGLY
ncbi:hypothetical protein ACFLUJ_03185 [Chloroflexota bacterium]